MYCKICGYIIDDDSNFCIRCGNTINSPNEQSRDNTSFSQKRDTLNNLSQSEIWYYALGSEQKGPFERKQIIEFIQQNTIDANTLIWRNGMPNWQPVYQTELSRYIITTAPTSPSIEISDKWIWSLATLPIVSSWIISTFLLNYGSNQTIVLSLTIILNIIFLTLDSKYLKTAGFNVDSWIYIGFVLVPVYLFVRESKTNKNYLPGIIWCVLFLINLII